MSKAQELLEKLSQMEEGKGDSTNFWKKLVKFVKSKVPGVTDADIKQVEAAVWSSGGNGKLTPTQAKAFEIMNKESLTDDIGATKEDFEEYSKAIGQA